MPRLRIIEKRRKISHYEIFFLIWVDFFSFYSRNPINTYCLGLWRYKQLIRTSSNQCHRINETSYWTQSLEAKSQLPRDLWTTIIKTRARNSTKVSVKASIGVYAFPGCMRCWNFLGDGFVGIDINFVVTENITSDYRSTYKKYMNRIVTIFTYKISLTFLGFRDLEFSIVTDFLGCSMLIND